MSPLRAIDLGLMIRLYGWAYRLAISANLADTPDAPKLARVALAAEAKVTGALLASTTSTARLGLALGGNTSRHWTALVEAMRARDEGRPLGSTPNR